MPIPQPDLRSESRKIADEALAAEPMLPIPELADDETPRPIEAFLPHRRPFAADGVVENGVIRLLDPQAKLPEHTRVIVVAAV